MAAVLALLAIVALAFWQWQALARMAIAAVVASVAHVRVVYGPTALSSDRATFDDLRIEAFDGEPIATIGRLELAYDLRDLLPGGKRRYGLEHVAVYSPRITIVRHADGTLNVPIPTLTSTGAGNARPLLLNARVRDGSIDVVDQRRSLPADLRHLYVRRLNGDATLAAASRMQYAATLDYGERYGDWYPVRGRGEADPSLGFSEQEWSAPRLPIAGAANFAAGSPSLALQSGMLRNAVVRYFALADRGTVRPHLAGSAQLLDGRVKIAGLAKPVDGMRGRIELYDDGLIAAGAVASIAGVPAQVSGGVYNLHDPQLRLAIRGSGDLAVLRSAFTQTRRVALSGPLDFSLLVEGSARRPLAWVRLRAPHLAYGSTAIDGLAGSVAVDGDEADLVNVGAGYRGANVEVRGRVALLSHSRATSLLLNAVVPPSAIPAALLAPMPLHAVATVGGEMRAPDVSGVLWGNGGSERVAGTFDLNGRGFGSIGPLRIERPDGSLYARVSFDRPHATVLGVALAHHFTLANGAAVDAAFFGGQRATTYGVEGRARVGTQWGTADAQTIVASRNGALNGVAFGSGSGEASFAASVGGTTRSPKVAGTVVVSGGRYRDFSVNGDATVAFANGDLRVSDAAAAIGPIFVGANGSVRGIGAGASLSPRYDFATQLRTADLGRLVAALRPQAAGLVEGSADANLRVTGAGANPAVSGVVHSSEGSVNGLAFRGFEGRVSADRQRVSVQSGRAVVGSTALGVDAAVSNGSSNFDLRAPRADLADFNDFFDAGDMFAGTGSVAVTAATHGTRIVATSGNVRLRHAAYRRIELGDVAADWQNAGNAIAANVRANGPHGAFTAQGNVDPASAAMDVQARAANADLSTWLPVLGFSAPVTGRLNAQTTIAGHYPDVTMRLRAAVFGGTIARLPVERFEIVADAAGGRGNIESLAIDVPSLATTGSGTFGLHDNDPIALTLHSTSPNIGELIARATGQPSDMSGTLDSSLHIGGTRAQPLLRDNVVLASLRRGNLTVPRVAGEIDASRHALAVRGGEVDLTHGRALFTGSVPIAITRTGIAPAQGALQASLTADDVELTNLAPLLPKDTQLGGRIDGTISARGTVASPQLDGALALRDGSYSGPMERSPITGIGARLAFNGTRAALDSNAIVGGGSVTVAGTSDVPNLRRLSQGRLNVEARAEDARIDVPGYLTGNVNGNVTLARSGSEPAQVGGEIALSNARIDPAAMLDRGSSGGSSRALPDIAFSGLRLTAANNVRLQSRSIDIGAAGSLLLGGRLSAPTLRGRIRATGGTLSFYRAFNIESGTVSFDGSGIVPDIDAVATTYVSDPPTAIRLHATGPATEMNLALGSDPSYDRRQILGLLVGAQQFGAVQGVNASGGSAFSAGAAAQQVAFNEVNTAFTRTMLEPLSSSVASALGFTSVQITSNVQTGVGLNATKAFGKNVTATYSQTIGYPRVQAISLEAHPNPATGVRMNWYTASGPTLFGLQQPQALGTDVLNLNRMTLLPPLTGTNGIDINYIRRYP